MRIKWTTLYVDDQKKALQFYTDKLGFQKKADFSQGNYRWLTVASPEDPEGVELVLESNANPAGKAYQEALHGRGQPAAQFLVKDVQAEHDRLAAKGVKFTMPVRATTGMVNFTPLAANRSCSACTSFTRKWAAEIGRAHV